VVVVVVFMSGVVGVVVVFMSGVVVVVFMSGVVWGVGCGRFSEIPWFRAVGGGERAGLTFSGHRQRCDYLPGLHGA
jgi:hypothetical protein